MYLGDDYSHTINFVYPQWVGGRTYAVGQIVAHNGSSYTCTTAHSNHEPPNATYWSVNTAHEYVDVSDSTFSAKVAAEINGTVLATFTIDTTNAATGTIVLSLSSSNVAAITTIPARYDVQRTVTSSTLKSTIQAGQVNVIGQVT